MQMPELPSSRFISEAGWCVTVQVPDTHVQIVLDHVLRETALIYGGYDCVSFATQPGTQRFRALGTGRNRATADVVTVPCCALSFFLSGDAATVAQVIEAIYHTHAYEEPVIYAAPCLRTLHVGGTDEDNPNRFWNQPTPDWVPDAHR